MYIGETIRDKPAYVTEGGIGLIVVPNNQNNTIMLNTSYKDTVFKNVNVNTTITMVATNNYYVIGELEVLGNAELDLAGTGTLKVF